MGGIWDSILWILYQILAGINSVLGNWGWSIIAFTFLIRLCMFPLDLKSKRSMKRMSDLQPKINEINKKYAKDKEKSMQKTQELYKKEKINPMAGCLPMLLQLPVLFAMFAVMRMIAAEQIVLMAENLMQGNQAVFEGWFWIMNIFQADSFAATVLPDLSSLAGTGASAISEVLTPERLEAARAYLASPEFLDLLPDYGANIRYTLPVIFFNINIPFTPNGWFILPVLAASSQFLSTKLMPQQPAADGKPNTNAQMMNYFFPLFSLWICATMNAAFSLYWVAANVIQILQQLAINKFFTAKPTAAGVIEVEALDADQIEDNTNSKH